MVITNTLVPNLGGLAFYFPGAAFIYFKNQKKIISHETWQFRQYCFMISVSGNCTKIAVFDNLKLPKYGNPEKMAVFGN